MSGREPLHVGVLVSGSGTNLQAILDAARSGAIDVDVRVVVSNRPRVQALERARGAGVPALVLSHRRFDTREAFEDELVALLRRHQVDWVVLAGFMRVLTRRFLAAFPDRVLNIHPSLLPAFPGVDAQRQAYDHGVKISGCTVHLVDEGTDTGAIVAQAAVPVRDEDDVESLRRRILEQEHRLYPRVLQAIAEGRVTRHGRRVQIAPGDGLAFDLT